MEENTLDKQVCKYPIVLVHGLGLKDTRFFKAFGQIEKMLKEQGFACFSAKTDAFATIEDNALMLKGQILKICEDEKTDKVNVIAHSKGGLDAKYMIESLSMSGKVASLTTLCTPHKGSMIATKIYALPPWLVKIAAFWVDLWYRLFFGDRRPNSYEVCRELQRVDSIETETVSFSNEVYCQSYSTKLLRSRDDFVMGIPLVFSKYFEKSDSDGIVAPNSAEFGEYKGECLSGESLSHSEIVDFMAKKKSKAKIYDFYTSLCRDLASRGF